ncbi:MAG: NlpC (ORF-17) [Spirochaetes bacterium]|nr:MAG: NlpC (ORF-17) [Spirochaetota bacterium]
MKTFFSRIFIYCGALLALWNGSALSHAQDIGDFLPPPRGIALDTEKSILLIAQALSWLGTPYRLGGMSRSGVDCSGLLYNVIGSAYGHGAPLPRRSEDFATFGVPLPQGASIEPGDILLFAQEGRVYHVGLALGGQAFIHAASEGSRTGVSISYLWEGGWGRAFHSARRLRED